MYVICKDLIESQKIIPSKKMYHNYTDFIYSIQHNRNVFAILRKIDLT